MVQLSLPYMTIGKNIALTTQNFVNNSLESYANEKRKDYLESLWIGEAPKENRKGNENKRREKGQGENPQGH